MSREPFYFESKEAYFLLISELIEKRKIKGLKSYQDLSDYFDLCRLLKDSGEFDCVSLAYDNAKSVYKLANERRKQLAIDDTKQAIKYYELAKKTALFLAYDSFEYYLYYIEWDREPKKKFYIPREKVLKTVVDDLQDLCYTSRQ